MVVSNNCFFANLGFGNLFRQRVKFHEASTSDGKSAVDGGGVQERFAGKDEKFTKLAIFYKTRLEIMFIFSTYVAKLQPNYLTSENAILGHNRHAGFHVRSDEARREGFGIMPRAA